MLRWKITMNPMRNHRQRLIAGDEDQNRGNQEFRGGAADVGHQLG